MVRSTNGISLIPLAFLNGRVYLLNMSILNFFKNLSTTEWIVILVIIFIFFGSKVLARLGKTGGETFREIKKVKNNFMDAVKDDDETTDTKKEEVSQ